jgi:hypothetical protein
MIPLKVIQMVELLQEQLLKIFQRIGFVPSAEQRKVHLKKSNF